ncbi:MAG TPA: formate dehydrogenase accessory sulfurtransferase FdhD, partial [Haloferula sp.]
MDKHVMAIDAEGAQVPDQVVIEEPLQIVIDGHPIAVTMRTPGHDSDLTLGFLLTEGVIRSREDVRKIDTDSRDNHALVFLSDSAEVDLKKLTRHVFSASSCGVCGKATIEAVTSQRPPLEERFEFSGAVLLAAPAKLEAAQSVFSRTGGLHAAGIFTADGTPRVIREDIGRHNAVDKVLGHALEAGWNLSQSFLLVSGRVSFEIKQKALAGGLPTVAAL